MAKSSEHGVRTSAEPEVLGLTPHALWLLVGDRELMLDFARFPWFARATIEQACDVVLLHGHHLHWPQLDVDLHVESIEHPDRYPLVSTAARSRRSAAHPRRKTKAPRRR